MGSFHFVPRTEVLLYKCAGVNHREEAGGPQRQKTRRKLCVCFCTHMKKWSVLVCVCVFLGHRGHSMGSLMESWEIREGLVSWTLRHLFSLSPAHLPPVFDWTINAPLPWGVVSHGRREECGASTCFSLTQDLVTHLTVNLIPSLSILSPGKGGLPWPGTEPQMFHGFEGGWWMTGSSPHCSYGCTLMKTGWSEVSLITYTDETLLLLTD